MGRQNKALASIIEQSDSHYVLDIFLYVKDRLTSENTVQPGDPTTKNGRLGIVPVILDSSTVHSVSSIQVKLPPNVKQQEKNIEMMYFELLRRFVEEGKGLPLLHPVEDMEIENERLTKLMEAQKLLTTQLSKDKLDKLPEESQMLFDRKEELKVEVRALEGSIREASEMIMRTDLINMKRVMRRLDMADKNDVPTLKGKVACSISATDEILITEMLFSGEFSDLEPHQVAAILSCLIYTDGKGSSEKDGQNKAQFKCEVLGKAFAGLQKTAERVADAMIDCKITTLDKEEYVAKFRPDLVELTQRWCQGATFKEICDEARDIYEGTIIRAFRRLDELITQLIECSKVIGNTALKEKFEAAQKNLKRGIVFTASLYL